MGGGEQAQGRGAAAPRSAASTPVLVDNIAPMQNDSESESDRESEEDELRFGVMFFKASRMQAVQKALRGGTSMRTKVEFVKHIYKKASKTPEGLKPALLAAFRAAFHSELPELRQVKSKLAKRAELYEEMLRGFESTALYFVPDLDPRFLLDPQSPHTRSAGKQRVAKKESKKKAAPAYEDFRPSDRVRFVDAAVHAQRGQGEVISIGYNLTFLNVRLDGTGKSMPVSRAEITKCTDTIATRRREKGNKHVSDANGTALEIGMAVTCVGLYHKHIALGRSGVLQRLKGRGYIEVQLENTFYYGAKGRVTKVGELVTLPARNVRGLVAVHDEDPLPLPPPKSAPRCRSPRQTEAEAGERKVARTVAKTKTTSATEAKAEAEAGGRKAGRAVAKTKTKTKTKPAAEAKAARESEAVSSGGKFPTHRLLSIGRCGRKEEGGDERIVVLSRPKKPVRKDRGEETATSDFTGVSSRSNGWQCRVTHNTKEVTLGQFKTEEEAARAYDRYVLIHDLERTLNYPAADYGGSGAKRRQSRRTGAAKKRRSRLWEGAAAASGGRSYVTEVTDESLRSIAAKFTISPKTLLRLNVANLPRLKIRSKLHVGTTIHLGNGKVKATATAAAEQGGESEEASMSDNSMSSNGMSEDDEGGLLDGGGDDVDVDMGGGYTTEVTSETLISIAAKFGDSAQRLLELNAWRLPGLTLKAKLRKGTSIDFIEAPASGEEEMSSDDSFASEEERQQEERRGARAELTKHAWSSEPPRNGGPNVTRKSSRFTGVSKTGAATWTARVTHERVEKKLGTFDNEVDAARAYDYFILKMDLPRTLNFPNARPPRGLASSVERDTAFANGPPLSARQRTSSSHFTGVSRTSKRTQGGWTTRITHDGVERKLGAFDNERAAARAYDAYVTRHRLDRRLNFPEKAVRASHPPPPPPQQQRAGAKQGFEKLDKTLRTKPAKPGQGDTVYVTYERLRALDGGTSVMRAEYHEGVIIGIKADGGVQVYFKGDGEYDDFGPGELGELLSRNAMTREQLNAGARGEMLKPIFAPLKKSKSPLKKAKSKANASAPAPVPKVPQPRMTRKEREAEMARQRWGESSVEDLAGLPGWSEWRDENVLLRFAGITFPLPESGGDGDGGAVDTASAQNRDALWRRQPLVRGERVVLSQARENGVHRSAVGVVTSIRGQGAIKVRLDKSREVITTRVVLVARLDSVLGDDESSGFGSAGAARSKRAGERSEKKKSRSGVRKPVVRAPSDGPCAACQGKHRAHTCARNTRPPRRVRGAAAAAAGTPLPDPVKSRFRGVTWDRARNQWRSAGPRIEGEEMTVHGYFDIESRAAEARDAFTRLRVGAWKQTVPLNFEPCEEGQKRTTDLREDAGSTDERRADEASENASLDAAFEAQIAAVRAPAPAQPDVEVVRVIKAQAQVVETRGVARTHGVVQDQARERAPPWGDDVSLMTARDQILHHAERAHQTHRVHTNAHAQEARSAQQVLRNERAQHAPFRQHAIELARLRAQAQMEWAQQQQMQARSQQHEQLWAEQHYEAQLQARSQANEQQWAQQHYEAQLRAHQRAQVSARAAPPNARAHALTTQLRDPQIERCHNEGESSTKYNGVMWEQTQRKWLAFGPQEASQEVPLLGYFADEEDAARARDYFVTERKLGAALNFPVDPVPAARLAGEGRGVGVTQDAWLSGEIRRADRVEKGVKVAALRRKRKAPSSQWIGVTRVKKNGGMWMAYATRPDGQQVNLGYHDTDIEGAKARDAYVLRNGLKRPLNFPPGKEGEDYIPQRKHGRKTLIEKLEKEGAPVPGALTMCGNAVV